MFWKKYFSSKSLLLIYGGERIIAQICDTQTIYGNTTFPLKKDLNEILADAKAHGCNKVYIFKFAEIREIDVKLGGTLDSEERYAAIEYAARSHFGEQAQSLRINCLDGMFHDFHSGVLISTFENDEVNFFATAAERNNLQFKGIISIQQLLLASHYLNLETHDSAILNLFEKNGFVATYDKHKLLVRNLPFGTPPDGIFDTEYEEKIARRLALLKHKDTILYAMHEQKAMADFMISPTLDVNTVRFIPIEDTLANAALSFLQKGHNIIHAAQRPSRIKDPKATGTFIALLMMGMTLLSMIFLSVQNHLTIQKINDRIAVNDALEKKVKLEEGKLKKIEDATLSEQTIHSILNQTERISKNIILVINLLERYNLRYTKIKKIIEDTRGITLEGETLWQPDLSNFFAHFSQELEKYHLLLFSEGLTLDKNGQMSFKASIRKGVK